MKGAAIKPPYNAGRRLRWLGAIVLGCVLIYTAGWFWAAGRVDRAVAEAARDSEATMLAWDCPGRKVIGFPFRIGVFCERFDVRASDGSVVIEAGAIRSAAQIYEPRRIIVEADSPVTVADAAENQSWIVTWDQGRGSAVMAPPDARRASFFTQGLTVEASDLVSLVTADEAAIHARARDGAADIAFNGRQIRMAPQLSGQRVLPPLGIDLDLTLSDFDRDWAEPAPRRAGIANRLALLLTDDRGIIADGPFSLSADGLLSGDFAVRVVDVGGVLDAARTSFPDYASIFAAVSFNVQRGQNQADDELSLNVTVRDGVMRLGFIPLGRIPPLHIDRWPLSIGHLGGS